MFGHVIFKQVVYPFACLQYLAGNLPVLIEAKPLRERITAAECCACQGDFTSVAIPSHRRGAQTFLWRQRHGRVLQRCLYRRVTKFKFGGSGSRGSASASPTTTAQCDRHHTRRCSLPMLSPPQSHAGHQVVQAFTAELCSGESPVRRRTAHPHKRLKTPPARHSPPSDHAATLPREVRLEDSCAQPPP